MFETVPCRLVSGFCVAEKLNERAPNDEASLQCPACENAIHVRNNRRALHVCSEIGFLTFRWRTLIIVHNQLALSYDKISTGPCTPVMREEHRGKHSLTQQATQVL